MTSKKLILGMLLAFTIAITMTSNNAYAGVPPPDFPPVITLLGDNPQTIFITDPYIELDATAFDTEDGDITLSIVIDSSTVDTNTIGTYFVTYDVTDSFGNPAIQQIRTINVIDVEDPVVTGSTTSINDGDVTELTNIDQYEESCTSTDNDPDYFEVCSVSEGSIDTSILGLQEVSYSATDASGNTGFDFVSTTVTDTTGPEITPNPITDPFSLELFDSYEEGCTATDNDNAFDGTCTFTGSIDTSISELQCVVYEATDPSDNTTTLEICTTIVDEIPPVITLLGDNPQEIGITDPYIELGATAFDIDDGDITEGIVIDASDVDVDTFGTYFVTYDVTDSFGNPAEQVVRTVNVIDDISPIITLLGDAIVDIPYASPYVDAGATASDINDGDITEFIVTINPVDTLQQQTTFFVTYDVIDESGNEAIQVIRTVNIGTAPQGDECSNCQDPSIGITSSGKRVVDNGITVNGKSMDANFYFTDFPLIQADIGEPVTMYFAIWDDRKDNIAHVEVGLGKGKIGESFGKLESSMIWNRHVMTKIETISYDETAFTDVTMEMVGKTDCRQASNDSSCDLFKVEFTPVKAIVGDVVFGISIWDDGKNAMTTFFNEGLQIGTESDVIPVVEFVAPEGNGNKPKQIDDGNQHIDERWSDAFQKKLQWHTENMEQLADSLGY